MLANKDLSSIHVAGKSSDVDAQGLSYRELNRILRSLDYRGADSVRIFNVEGQRYIGTRLAGIREIEIYGIPGNDLGCFMNGPKITVHGSVQDGCGNTMSGGSIIVHGSAGDILGYAMRGGKIFIQRDAGYRAGIHMKEYRGLKPIIVIGGTVGDFLGEYMAGGILVLLGLDIPNRKHDAKWVGTGMHGGVIYVHGDIRDLSRDVEKARLDNKDWQLLTPIIEEYSRLFNLDFRSLIDRDYYKLRSKTIRPYGNLYAY